jgi:hypothetical protein
MSGKSKGQGSGGSRPTKPATQPAPAAPKAPAKSPQQGFQTTPVIKSRQQPKRESR